MSRSAVSVGAEREAAPVPMRALRERPRTRSHGETSRVPGLPGIERLADPDAYLAAHSRSFRFASAMMAKGDRARIARVYAWCR